MEHFLKLGLRKGSYNSGPLKMPIKDRRKHMLISGKSGMGKSTLLANIFYQEANSGVRGALLIDPHGDLAEQALDLIPKGLIHKVIYFNPNDTEFPIRFNPLDGCLPQHRALHADNIVATFRSLFDDSWGPRMEHILRNTVGALLEVPGSTLLGVRRMLIDRDYRQRIVDKVQDRQIKSFWTQEFPGMEKKFGAEAVSPVLNKVGAFLSSPIVRNILGQPKSAFSPRQVMDSGGLFIANLSKGLLGDTHSNLLGSLLVTTFGQAAMSRADIADPEQRRDFSMIVDEIGNYTTSKFADLLSEARKYRLSLTLAHQYLDQMSKEVRDAVVGNVGSIIAFRVGAEDGQFFARQFGDLEARHVTETDTHHAWCRLEYYGSTTDTFLLQTRPDPRPHGHAQKVINYSRNRYTSPRAEVEARIDRFLTNETEAIHPMTPRRRATPRF